MERADGRLCLYRALVAEWLVYYELYLVNGNKLMGPESPDHLTEVALQVLHGQFAPEYLVRPPGTPWSNISGTHCHIAPERLVNFSGIPNLGRKSSITDQEIDEVHKEVREALTRYNLIS